MITSRNNGASSHTVRGVLFLVFGLAVFSLMDVIIKLLSDSYSAHQIMFVRGMVAIVPLALIVYWEGGAKYFLTERLSGHIMRGVLGFGAFTCYYLALSALTLAETVALFFMSPIFITLFGYLFLKERVGIHRWSAILTGFAGVLVITQPGFGTFNSAMLLALGSAMLYAAMTMMTRRLADSESGSSTAFYSMSVFIVLSAVVGGLIGDGRYAGGGNTSAEFLLRAWSMPTSFDLLLMGATGIIACIGFYCLSHAYRDAPVSVVSLFEYTALPWAILWGYVFWQDVPSQTTLLGLTLIIGSGLYIFYREHLRSR